MLINPALGRLRQEDQKFKTSLGYTATPSQKAKQTDKSTGSGGYGIRAEEGLGQKVTLKVEVTVTDSASVEPSRPRGSAGWCGGP